jgi:hypothetical protein
MSEHEPLVTLAELGYNDMKRGEAEAFGEVFGVTVRWDFLDRPGVSLDDAYVLGERRRRLEREFADEQSRRANAEQQAIRDLEVDLVAVFKEARDVALREAPRGGDRHAFAINVGLQAARIRWMAAPINTRQAVTSITIEHPDGSASGYDLGMVMPRSILDAGIDHAVQRAEAAAAVEPL